MNTKRQEIDLLTPEQVAHELQIPKSSVYRLAEKGTLKTLRLGKLLRVRRSEIYRALQTVKKIEIKVEAE